MKYCLLHYFEITPANDFRPSSFSFLFFFPDFLERFNAPFFCPRSCFSSSSSLPLLSRSLESPSSAQNPRMIRSSFVAPPRRSEPSRAAWSPVENRTASSSASDPSSHSSMASSRIGCAARLPHTGTRTVGRRDRISNALRFLVYAGQRSMSKVLRKKNRVSSAGFQQIPTT